MAILRSPGFRFLCALHLLLISAQVFSYQYKVGDLDAWGIPAGSDSQVYAKWSKYHSFKLGDSLWFLYPPSQDSVVQVTRQAYDACNVTDPILHMSDGNSLFNVTSPGVLYFTSGAPGHCEKKQKLQISVLSGNGSAYAPSASSALPDISPSYPTVFGSIPAGSSSAHSRGIPALAAMVIGLLAYAATGGGGGGSGFM